MSKTFDRIHNEVFVKPKLSAHALRNIYAVKEMHTSLRLIKESLCQKNNYN